MQLTSTQQLIGIGVVLVAIYYVNRNTISSKDTLYSRQNTHMQRPETMLFAF